MWKERRLGVFENMVLRIFGPKWEEATGERRHLHHEEVNDLCCSPSFVRMINRRRMRWAGHVVQWGRREAYTWLWSGNLRERDHFWRPRLRWEDNIKLDLQEVGYGIWIGSSWLRRRTGGGDL